MTDRTIVARKRDVLWDPIRVELRRIADLSPLMVWITEADGYCIYLNDRWYDFTGQKPGSAEASGWLDAVHADDRALASRAFSYATTHSLPYHVEYRLCRHDDHYEWVVAVGHPYFTQDGKVGGYLGSDASVSGLVGQSSQSNQVLTRREREVVEWVAQGKTAPEIGTILNLSGRTVEVHIRSAMTKLGTTNRVQMAVEAIRRGIIDLKQR